MLSCLGSQEPEGGVVLGLYPLRLDSVIDLSVFNMFEICMLVAMLNEYSFGLIILLNMLENIAIDVLSHCN